MATSVATGPSGAQLTRLMQRYTAALREAPSDLVLRTKLAEVLRLLGRIEDAVALYSSIAWAHGVAGDLGQAITVCKLILELKPEHSETQEMLAKLFASKKIRELKHSVPVVQVGGRWVVDPRQSAQQGPESARHGRLEGGAPPPDAASAADRALREVPTPDERPLTRSRRQTDIGGHGAPITGPVRPTDGASAGDAGGSAERTVDLTGRSRALRKPPAPTLSQALPRAEDLPESARVPTVVGEPAPEPPRPPVVVRTDGDGKLTLGEAGLGEDEQLRRQTVHLLRARKVGPAASAPASGSAEASASSPQAAPHDIAVLSHEAVSSGEPPPSRLEGQQGKSRPTARLDAVAVESLLRLDAQLSTAPVQRSQGYASIRREVESDGRSQAVVELPREAMLEVEREVADTLRDPLAAHEVGSIPGLESYRVPFPIFSELDTSAFLAVVKRLERRVLAPGETVFCEGDPGDSLYLISSGVLEVIKRDAVGQTIDLARLGGGSFFGEFGLLTDGRRHATVVCAEETELLELRRDELLQLSQEHPSVGSTLRAFYDQRVMANVIATSPIFRAVSTEERTSVLSQFQCRRFEAGETIISEGTPGSGFFIILLGSVEVSCSGQDGGTVPLGILAEGDYFGEMSLLSGCAAEATVCTLGITETLMLVPQDFYAVAADHPEIWVVVQEECERRRQDTAARRARRAGAERAAAGGVCLI